MKTGKFRDENCGSRCVNLFLLKVPTVLPLTSILNSGHPATLSVAYEKVSFL